MPYIKILEIKKGDQLEATLALATLLGGFTALWFLFDKIKVRFDIFRFFSLERELSIFVDNFGRLDQEEAVLINSIDKACGFLVKNKKYTIKVVNNRYEHKLVGQSCNGINKETNKTISGRLGDTERALMLLVNMKVDGYLKDFSDAEFISMVKGTLKYSDLSPYDPLLGRLDIWFKGNKAFRTTIDFSSIELKKLFEDLEISDLFQIMDGSVFELPRVTLCGKVIPAIVYALEKYSEQYFSWQMEEHFRIELWNYGIA